MQEKNGAGGFGLGKYECRLCINGKAIKKAGLLVKWAKKMPLPDWQRHF
jgi:hypothetical protein